MYTLAKKMFKQKSLFKQYNRFYKIYKENKVKLLYFLVKYFK